MRCLTPTMVIGMCGIGVIKGFMDEQQVLTAQGAEQAGKILGVGLPPILAHPKRRAGFVSSGFINDAKCREAYAELSQAYRLVFQTPVRINTNSKNPFFFAMWDTTGDNDVTPINGKWPF